MIDLHCHLDLYPNVLQLLSTVAEMSTYVLFVTTSPRRWQATREVFKSYENIECAVGMHPEIVSEKYSERALLLQSISECRFIGEVGIDGSTRHKGTIDRQTEVFTDVVRESERVGGRILSIHSRNAATPILDIIEGEQVKSTYILHWFTGSMAQLSRAIDLGCLFSVGPAMLLSSKGKQLVSRIPLERILPESDGPFARLDGEPILPWEAMSIGSQVASLHSLTEQQVNEGINQNFSRLIAVADRIPLRST